MSTNRRTLILEHANLSHHPSSPAFSPPETPASASFSPQNFTHLPLSGRRKSRPSKRRKSAGTLKSKDLDASADPHQTVQNNDLDDEDGEREEEDARKEIDDDDYTVRKREDLLHKEKLRVLLDHFDPQQMDRYTEYRNSGLAKANVRKLANSVLQQSVSDRVTIVTRGLAKVFVGEMVERALEVQRRRGGTGPLTPFDLREAYRAHLAERDRGGSDRRKMFCR